MSFTLAIVGRPNVGKSTLFNRLTGKRRALVDDTPGVTRDWREGEARLGPLEFKAIDTAGLEEAEKDTLSARMTAMTQAALAHADAALLILDARAGVTPADQHFAKLLRKSGKPVILVLNKAESGAAAARGDAYKLGLGEPVAISAEHGEGMGELYEALSSSCGERSESAGSHAAQDDAPLSIAIIGRPNVGKSTLFNRILGRERTLTGPEAGITRDAITVDAEFEGRKIKLVDTAGMRRKSSVTAKIEKLAVADALLALKFAEVAIWVVDANAPLEKQDNAIASLIEQEGRAVVLAVNKWDEVTDKKAWTEAIDERLSHVLPQSKGIAVVPVSAKEGTNIGKLLKACFRAHMLWNKEIATGQLNRWLESALEKHQPPLVKGRRIKIRYATQKSARPPTFLLFANISDIPEHYLRYLANDLREHFALPGVPIRLRIRRGNNPYAPRD